MCLLEVKLLYVLQLVAEAAAGPSQEEEARQASVQELQSLRDSLSQAEARTKELEGQLENINKVGKLAESPHFYSSGVICADQPLY